MKCYTKSTHSGQVERCKNYLHTQAGLPVSADL